MMRKATILLLFLLVAGLGVAACGEQAAPQTLTLRARDVKFDVTTLTVKAGQPVALTYINEGVMDHAFQIDKVVSTEKVRPGETRTFHFTIKAPGAYRYICLIPGHELAGMVGVLVVEP
jgi:plastocyanin